MDLDQEDDAAVFEWFYDHKPLLGKHSPCYLTLYLLMVKWRLYLLFCYTYPALLLVYRHEAHQRIILPKVEAERTDHGQSVPSSRSTDE